MSRHCALYSWQDLAGGRPKRFIPFSDGRRDCIGQALAKMNYTAVLAMLLGRYHFELAPEVLFSPFMASLAPLVAFTPRLTLTSLSLTLTQTFRLDTLIIGLLPQKYHAVAQVGGVDGVLKAEHMAMTLQPGDGLLMRVTRREHMPPL